MGIEIERKFLLKNSNWKKFSDQGINIKQGYLNTDFERTVRVRITEDKGVLCIKGKNNNISRVEFEYEIPLNEAISLLALCENAIIEKTRYKINQDEITWEIDVFKGDNAGLIVAEVELYKENQIFNKPDWIGLEVSHESKYFNSALSIMPYKNWRGE